MAGNSFGARSSLEVGDRTFEVFRLDALQEGFDVARLPYSIKILLENVLRHEDGVNVRADDVEALARWDATATPTREIAFAPARILMQDFTGVPAIVDLAAMRDAVADMGGDPDRINPLVPAELVIDHSVVADVYGVPEAFRRNADLEFERNRERYQFLRWGQTAFANMRIVPPDTGICHQVNLEYLARVVFSNDAGQAYPDTLLGTDSHTPMVNGLGVLGWGVGGIEAEAAMLGQPVSMLMPQVVGFRLFGTLPEAVTATDLVLTVTEILRQRGVVGKFVEFYGPGVGAVPLENRATIGNMSPEYGSTCSIFPIDDETLRYLELTGRPAQLLALVESYAKEQGLFHDPHDDPVYSETVELDLSTVEPSIAGPTRPQDRVALSSAKGSFRAALSEMLGEEPSPDPGPNGVPNHVAESGVDAASAFSFPASDPSEAIAGDVSSAEGSAPYAPASGGGQGAVAARSEVQVPVRLADGREIALDHGHAVIAAITSCTNTSNPQVMVAAALLARKAVERGVGSKPWVKTSLAPGSKVVMDYYEQAGLTPYLEKLGFNLVGFGCTTCIGNSGPLAPEIAAAVDDSDLVVCSVLSGNRNFEGRIHPQCRMNYLASPPLVVAYALAGTMDIDFASEPLGQDESGRPVYLRDVWPSVQEVEEVIRATVRSEMFRASYEAVFDGDERWVSLPVPAGRSYDWDDSSTYVHKPPFFESMPRDVPPMADITGARVLALLGDSVTTDHISPAGVIRRDSPAGRWLIERGVEPADFNSYGARRGNHEVMIRGTFANIRLRNQLAPGTEGGVTIHLPDGEQMTIYDAAMRYADESVPLVVLAGKDYGSGSSRDWAAKGTALLGVRAVLAASFERIHRSNLIGMGVLPLQLPDGQSVASLGLTGHEVINVVGLAGLGPDDPIPRELTVRADDTELRARVRIDTPKEADYFRNGGILHYVLRQP
ncbi:MAG TPA: aconitate hydratase [Acidimicrobiales bacterium]